MKTKETYLDQNILYICNCVNYNKQNNIKYDYDLDFFVYKVYRIYESEYKLKEINMLYQIYKPNFNLGRWYWLQLCLNYIPIVLTIGKWKKPLKKLELIKSVQKFKKDFVPILSPHKVISSSLVRKLNDDINNQTMYLNKLNQKIGYILVTTLGFIFGGSLSSIYLGIKIPNYLMIKNLVVFLLPVFIMFIYITSCNKQRVQCFNKLAKFIQFQKKSDLYLRYEENLFANSDKKCTVLYNLLSHENEFEFVIVVCIIVISLLIV